MFLQPSGSSATSPFLSSAYGGNCNTGWPASRARKSPEIAKPMLSHLRPLYRPSRASCSLSSSTSFRPGPPPPHEARFSEANERCNGSVANDIASPGRVIRVRMGWRILLPAASSPRPAHVISTGRYIQRQGRGPRHDRRGHPAAQGQAWQDRHGKHVNTSATTRNDTTRRVLNLDCWCWLAGRRRRSAPDTLTARRA